MKAPLRPIQNQMKRAQLGHLVFLLSLCISNHIAAALDEASDNEAGPAAAPAPAAAPGPKKKAKVGKQSATQYKLQLERLPSAEVCFTDLEQF